MQLDDKKKACLCLYSFLVSLLAMTFFWKISVAVNRFYYLDHMTQQDTLSGLEKLLSTSYTLALRDTYCASLVCLLMYYIFCDEIPGFLQWWNFVCNEDSIFNYLFTCEDVKVVMTTLSWQIGNYHHSIAFYWINYLHVLKDNYKAFFKEISYSLLL